MIHLDAADGVATLTIDRQDRRNALNLEAVELLDERLDEVLAAEARVLVLQGAGGHFCAGADLKELEDLHFTTRLRTMLDRLAELPIPVLAAVEGSCMGLGMQLALACDVRVVAADAKLAVPVARLGLMVDHWTLRRLSAALGWGAARQLVLFADVISGDDAYRLGFAQFQGGPPEAAALAARVTKLAPLALSGSKLGLNLLEDHAPVGEYQAAFERAWASADLAEGRAAFNEGRPPTFSGN
jgi:enoyl-CoA hydratase